METGGKMKGIFDLIRSSEGGEGEKKTFRLGLRLKIGDQETVCPLTRSFESFEALEDGVRFIKEDLGIVVERARGLFKGTPPTGEGLDVDVDATPEEIWTLLAKIEDENSFVDMFNGLDEARRKAIAEHVLAHCNVFTGKASIFSSRYDNDSGLME
jgi:hypothetical protein